MANHGSTDSFDENKSVLKFLFDEKAAQLKLLNTFVHDLHIRNDLIFQKVSHLR